MSAVRATFEDVKRVKTRKVWQLIFEVPEENYDAAIETLGGSPRSGTDRWVGIAPVTAPAIDAERPKGGERAKRAGILCNDPAFQAWLWKGEDPWLWHGEVNGSNSAETTADLVRKLCGVTSRAQLDHHAIPGQTFDRMVDAFYHAQRGDTDKDRIAQRDRAS